MINKARPEEHSSEHLWYAFPGTEANWENTQMINFYRCQSSQIIHSNENEQLILKEVHLTDAVLSQTKSEDILVAPVNLKSPNQLQLNLNIRNAYLRV